MAFNIINIDDSKKNMGYTEKNPLRNWSRRCIFSFAKATQLPLYLQVKKIRQDYSRDIYRNMLLLQIIEINNNSEMQSV